MMNYIYDAETHELSIIAASNNALRPKWRDANGALWATYEDDMVVKSVDNGVTWSTVLTITGGDIIGCGLMVSDTGRIIVGDYAGKQVFVSNEAQTSYAQAFVFGDASYFSQQMAQCMYDNIVIIGGYDGNAIGEDARKEVWMSQDYGATWSKIFTAVVLNAEQNCHIHDVEYDPWDERIYVSIGDNDNKNIYYSDDMGENWTAVFENSSHAKNQQPSQIIAFEHGIILGSDSAYEGLHYWAKPSVKATINPDDIQLDFYPLDTTGSLVSFAVRKWVRRGEHPLCLIPFSKEKTGGYSRILASLDGLTWDEIYKHYTIDTGFKNIIGSLSSVSGEGVMAIFMEGNDVALNIFTRSSPIYVERNNKKR